MLLVEMISLSQLLNFLLFLVPHLQGSKRGKSGECYVGNALFPGQSSGQNLLWWLVIDTTVGYN